MTEQRCSVRHEQRLIHSGRTDPAAETGDVGLDDRLLWQRSVWEARFVDSVHLLRQQDP